MKKSCVHIYTGNGKGKTTAAVGLAVRAAGAGLRVGFFQFLKNGRSSELDSLEKLGVAVFSPRSSGKFLWEMDEAEKKECARQQQALLEQAAADAANFDLMVLDEGVCALDTAMVEEETLLAFIKNRPPGLELVLTGRGAGSALIALGDYVTEMRPLAHPFDSGGVARKGIEF